MSFKNLSVVKNISLHYNVPTAKSSFCRSKLCLQGQIYITKVYSYKSHNRTVIIAYRKYASLFFSEVIMLVIFTIMRKCFLTIVCLCFCVCLFICFFRKMTILAGSKKEPIQTRRQSNLSQFANFLRLTNEELFRLARY